MFTGSRVSVAAPAGSDAGPLVIWQAGGQGPAVTLKLQVVAVAPDGGTQPVASLQQHSDTSISFPAAPPGRYRVLALLPPPTADAGDACPERMIRGTLLVRGTRVDHPSQVAVEGTWQGCVGDPALLLRLDEFTVR